MYDVSTQGIDEHMINVHYFIIIIITIPFTSVMYLSFKFFLI